MVEEGDYRLFRNPVLQTRACRDQEPSGRIELDSRTVRRHARRRQNQRNRLPEFMRTAPYLRCRARRLYNNNRWSEARNISSIPRRRGWRSRDLWPPNRAQNTVRESWRVTGQSLFKL